MNPYEQLLGIAPLPAKTAAGTQHIPAGCIPVKSVGVKPTSREAAAKRRAYIAELCGYEPMTTRELIAELDVTEGITPR